MNLPPYTTRALVQERLLLIFPEGSVEHRNYCTREIAASTVFTMLYIGAVDGTNRYTAPKQIIKMSDEQEARTNDAARIEYAEDSLRPRFQPDGAAWYADNSREPVRDETLRQGLIPIGAVAELKGIPTSSPKPRYALAADFAALFDPQLIGDKLEAAIKRWKASHLSQAAITRVALLRAGAAQDATAVIVKLPNGSTHTLAAGASSIISKSVIEEFAPRYLEKPAVIWLSESGNKVVEKHDILARKIGLKIDDAKVLPDIILADLGGDDILLVFVEVVATDGPINTERRRALLALASAAKLGEDHVAVVTAYMDRTAPVLKRTFQTVAWNSFIWLAGEPENIIALQGPAAGLRLRLLMHR